MNTALLVFTENIDEYTLNQQIRALQEQYDIDQNDIYAVHDKESYENLKEIIETINETYQGLVYLTEDFDWLNFERDFKSEFGHLFEDVKVHPCLAKRLHEGDIPAQTTVPPVKNVKNTVSQEEKSTDVIDLPNNLSDIIYFPYNAPYGATFAVVKTFSGAANPCFVLPNVRQNYGNKFQNDIGKNRFCSSDFIEEMVIKYILKKDVYVLRIDLNANSRGIGSIKKRITEKGNAIKLWAPAQEKTFATNIFYQPGDIQIPIQPLQNHDYNSNQSCYQHCLNVWKEIKDVKASADEIDINKDKNKNATDETAKAAKAADQLEQLQKKHPNKDPKWYEKEIEKQNKNIKTEKKEKKPIDSKAILIFGVIQEAIKFSSGKINESESNSSSSSKDDRLERMAKALGLDKDAAMGREATKQAGFELILDVAKAAEEGLKGDDDNYAEEHLKKLGFTEDEIAQINAMVRNETYQKQLEPMFGNIS